MEKTLFSKVARLKPAASTHFRPVPMVAKAMKKRHWTDMGL